VLLLGSCGTSHLAQNHDVVIIDNLATAPGRVNIEHLLDHPRLTFIEWNITDLDLLMEARWAEGPEREHR
jgi:nucleoside-diphosphate-sugar epimerase